MLDNLLNELRDAAGAACALLGSGSHTSDWAAETRLTVAIDAIAAALPLGPAAPGPFLKLYGPRELYLAPDKLAFTFHRPTGLAGYEVLSPTEADELGGLIHAALNAYAPALAWAQNRAAK